MNNMIIRKVSKFKHILHKENKFSLVWNNSNNIFSTTPWTKYLSCYSQQKSNISMNEESIIGLRKFASLLSFSGTKLSRPSGVYSCKTQLQPKLCRYEIEQPKTWAKQTNLEAKYLSFGMRVRKQVWGK